MPSVSTRRFDIAPRRLAVVVWCVAMGVWGGVAAAHWSLVTESVLPMPGGVVVQRLLPQVTPDLLLVEDLQGTLWRLEVGGQPARVFSLQEGLFGAERLREAAILSGQEWLWLMEEGQAWAVALDGLRLNRTQLTLPRGRVPVFMAAGGGGGVYALTVEEDRTGLLRLHRKGSQLRIVASDEVVLPGEPMALAVPRRQSSAEGRVSVVVHTEKGTAAEHLGLNEAGVFPVGEEVLLAPEESFVELVPCGVGGLHALLSTVFDDPEPHRVRLLTGDLRPVEGLAPLTLTVRHFPWRCSVDPVAGAEMALVSERGVSRTYRGYPFVMTVRGKPVRGLPSPLALHGGWYLPLPPLARRAGFEARVLPEEGAIAMVYQGRNIRAVLDGVHLSVGGKSKKLARPLVITGKGGQPWVDVEWLWPLLDIPVTYSAKGPVVHVRPSAQTAEP